MYVSSIILCCLLLWWNGVTVILTLFSVDYYLLLLKLTSQPYFISTWQPDRQKGSEKEKEEAEAKFREINLANEILSDPVKKRRYDEGVDEQDIDDPNARPNGGHSHGGMGGMGGMDQEMLFHMFMRQQQARGGGHSPFG